MQNLIFTRACYYTTFYQIFLPLQILLFIVNFGVSIKSESNKFIGKRFGILIYMKAPNHIFSNCNDKK